MYFSAAPAQTYYYELHGSGPPLLLLHGFTGSVHNWTTLTELLKDSYRLILLDLPGHGRSQVPPEPAAYAMPTVAAHIVALLNHLGYDDVHLLGYSMGGRLALYLVLHFPQRWRSLILESASPGLAAAGDREARVAADRALADFVEQQGIEAFVARWEALPLFATQQKLPAAVREAHRALRLQNRPQGLANSLRGMGTGVQPSLWQRLSALALPVLLIAGSLDEKYIAIARQMTQRVPHARLEIIAGAGHTVHLEQPDLYQAVIRCWLHENSKGSAS